jgi:hypothetical protein
MAHEWVWGSSSSSRGVRSPVWRARSGGGCVRRRSPRTAAGLLVHGNVPGAGLLRARICADARNFRGIRPVGDHWPRIDAAGRRSCRSGSPGAPAVGTGLILRRLKRGPRTTFRRLCQDDGPTRKQCWPSPGWPTVYFHLSASQVEVLSGRTGNSRPSISHPTARWLDRRMLADLAGVPERLRNLACWYATLPLWLNRDREKWLPDDNGLDSEVRTISSRRSTKSRGRIDVRGSYDANHPHTREPPSWAGRRRTQRAP